MMTTEQIRAALQDRVLTRVSEATGISRATLHRIKRGADTNLTEKTIKALSDYLGGGQ